MFLVQGLLLFFGFWFVVVLVFLFLFFESLGKVQQVLLQYLRNAKLIP